MEVIIIGAGLAGLTASVCLASAGHRVQILEKKEKLWTVGGAINLTSGAVQTLALWDLRERLESISDHTVMAYRRDLKTAACHQEINLDKVNKSKARTVMRSNLMQLLYARATEMGVDVSFNSNVKDISETDDAATVTFANGTSISADLIIGADGVRSRVRHQILAPYVSPEDLEPITSDRTYYQARWPGPSGSTLPQSLFDAEYLGKTPTSLHFWAGSDERYCISLYNPSCEQVTIVYALKEATDQTSLWDENADLTAIREKFEGRIHPDLQLGLDEASGCERWKLVQMPDLPRWRSEKERIIILGDSCHAMHPTAGQGYSSTVEEISVLSYILDHDKDRGEALKKWEAVCKPRSNRLKAFANFLSRQYEGDPEVLKESMAGMQRRAELMKDDPHLDKVVIDMNAGFESPEFGEWNLRFDALAEARKFLGSQTNGH